MRTVIYARFSSDNQNPRSIADQIALCRRRAEQEGWTIVGTYEDAAISGAAGIDARQRPGLNAMLAQVEAGGVEQVLAESTDRITRHVADAHVIRERIEFAGARLFTLFDGRVTPMIGLVKGFMDAQFRTDLAQRVRRGQVGTLRQGRVPYAIAYGYRQANRLNDRGEVIRGLREPDPEQAAIVRRIFAEYVAGRSPLAIAAGLNADGVPAPRGSIWHASAIQGDVRHKRGILRNEIYVGIVTYGLSRVVINPTTRRRLMRPGEGDAVERKELPHLRIIDEETWAKAQARIQSNIGVRPERQRRPKHILSGLGVCGVCGGPWVKASGDFWRCSHYTYGRRCTNNRMVNTSRYEQWVLADLKAGLRAPDMIREYLREYHRDFARQAAELGRDRSRLERKLRDAEGRMERLLKAFSDGGSEFAEIRDMLAAARDEKERLARELANMDALPNVLALHPQAEAAYLRQVDELEEALAQPEAQLEAIPRLRAMIARIIVRPNEAKSRGVTVEVVRQMDEILSIVVDPGKISQLR